MHCLMSWIGLFSFLYVDKYNLLQNERGFNINSIPGFVIIDLSTKNPVCINKKLGMENLAMVMLLNSLNF